MHLWFSKILNMRGAMLNNYWLMIHSRFPWKWIVWPLMDRLDRQRLLNFRNHIWSREISLWILGGLGKALAQFDNAERLHYCHKKCWKQKKYHLAYVVKTSLLVFLVTLKLPRIALPIHILVSDHLHFPIRRLRSKSQARVRAAFRNLKGNGPWLGHHRLRP